MSNASAALRAYRWMKNLKKIFVSVNADKCIIGKFDITGSLGVEPERRRRTTETAFVEQDAVAIARASANS